MHRLTPARSSPRLPAARGWRRSRRGVSQVVATILLLAVSVALFTGLFFFVYRFPQAPPSASGTFDATLSYGGSTVSRISILHLSGPTISGPGTSTVAIYIVSVNHPTAIPGPFSLSAGLPGGSSVWAFGENWTLSLAPYGLSGPDNLTVSIVSMSQLVYRAVLGVSAPFSVPYFVSAQITPNPAGPAVTYTITASVVCSVACASSGVVTANISEVQGSTTTETLACVGSCGASGQYSWTSSSASIKTPSPSSPTVYFVFLTLKDSAGRTSTLALSFTVT